MKLLGCHIDNFGKLTDYRVDFKENPQVFYEPNGWGKSTLAAFIKVMFYGFAGESKRGTTLEKERLRYKPWQGGVYGGELSFEAGGRRYLLNRTFGNKEAEDTFALYDADTNLRSEDYTANIGEELFQINQESFLRTVFLAQNDCDTVATDSINAKIGNLADNLDDINNYEKVQQVLKDLRNSMSPTRKTGSLKKQKEIIAEFKDELRKSGMVEAAVAELEKKVADAGHERERLSEERKNIQKTWESLTRKKAVEAKKTHYASILSQCQDKERQVAEDLAAMGGQVPKREILENVREKINALENLRLEAARMVLDERELLEKQHLEEQFHCRGDFPQEQVEQLGELEARLEEGLHCLRKYMDQKNGLGAKKAALDSLKGLRQQQLVRRKQQMQQNRLLLEQRMEKLQGRCRAQQKARTGAMTVLIAGIVLAVAGGILLAFVNQTAGIALLCAGAVAAVLGMVLVMMGRKSMAALLGEMNVVEDQLQRNDESSEELLWQENAMPEEDLEQEIAKDEEQMAHNRQLIENVLSEIGNVEWEDSLWLQEKLYGWKDDIHKLQKLLGKEQDYFAKDFEGRMQNLREQINTALKPFDSQTDESAEPVPMEPLGDRAWAEVLQRLTGKLNDYENGCRELDRLKAEKQAFEENNDIKAFEQPFEEIFESEEELRTGMDSLDEALSSLAEQVHAYQRQLEDKQAQLEEFALFREQLAEAEAEYAEGETYYKRIGYVSDYLEKAKESLSAKYIGPVFESFKRNYELLAGEPGEDFRMDANIQVTRRALGEQRQTGAFSAGNRDLINIVLRVALVEAMYQKEKPFLVIDDSFVNLDGKRLETAGKFLKQIAKDYQVIYFTCHESRIPT